MKTFLIIAGVGLVCLLLMIRFFFSEFNTHDKEREWFVQNLRYEFSFEVDTVQIYYNTRGQLSGRVTTGDPKFYREDSLQNSLKKHERLWLLNKHRNDSIAFNVQIANEIQKGDSVRISSKENSITVFRAGKQVATTLFTNEVNGWGKPPFRTK
jgi:hypothetical protein